MRIWECGLRNSQIVLELRLCIFNPKSEISDPKYDDSSGLPHEVKTSSGGSLEPGPLDLDFLIADTEGFYIRHDTPTIEYRDCRGKRGLSAVRNPVADLFKVHSSW